MDRKKKFFLALIAVMIVIVLIVSFVLAQKLENYIISGEGENSEALSLIGKFDSRAGTIVYKDNTYKINHDIVTLLIMGIDNFGKISDSGYYRNDGLADFLTLVIFDRSRETYSILQLNRDTMTEITVLGIGGKEAGTITGQLALAHTYGGGIGDSCRNEVKAVSKLLYGTKVNNYISFNMDAVSIINDLVGGVTVEVLDSFEDSDILKKGETVTLTGELALEYVRGRSEMAEEKTNIARMERQKQYIDAFLKILKEKIEENSSFLNDSRDELTDYTVTDMNVSRMSQISQYIKDYTLDGVYTIEGEAVAKEYMEYYVDQEKLKELVLDLFFKKEK